MRHLWLVVVIGLFFPTLLVADELADLKAQWQTRQANMAALQQKVIALESQPLPPPSPPSETTESATTEVADVTADIEDLKAQQETLIQKLQESLEFNLYATLEYTSIDREPSAFDARNVGLLIGGRLTDRLKGFAEIEFERTAKTSAGTRQGEVEVEQAWLEYSINEALKPRFGVILVPFGRYNLEHFEPNQELTSRLLLARRVTPTTWAEAGIGFTGRTQFGDRVTSSWFDELSTNYQFFFVNGLTNHLTDKGLRDARGVPYDITILDMHMPDMDGIQLARAIQTMSEIAAVRLVMLTSVGIYGDAQKAKKAGVLAYLSKPVWQVEHYRCLASVVLSGAELSAQVSRSQPRETATRSKLQFAVLLPEDNPVNQEVAKGRLESFGCRVDVAANGQEALGALDRNTYDLVLMD